ncbi:hypothetical protein HS041_26620 [Planomonospora sp. ID67723]|uniref:hypothetical protein n=1 Tax=Planomonospora sp. ID67723 TaxID=2738134 RepID=UPI0018C3E29C|nr:hypothetical protein [Planomonospora sp. ID67723]MBG0831326.1 hypothetical protein [Planomonospora sp. ID67723]
MRTWRKLSKLTAVAAVAGGLAFTATPAAIAAGDSAREKAAALTCGGNVFLDGIRALTISENGRDEVYLEADGVKIWPSGRYVSMAAGQRVEVDKCVRPQAALRLIEVDDLDPNDLIGRVILEGDVTKDYYFCCGGGARYRIGAVR